MDLIVSCRKDRVTTALFVVGLLTFVDTFILIGHRLNIGVVYGKAL